MINGWIFTPSWPTQMLWLPGLFKHPCPCDWKDGVRELDTEAATHGGFYRDSGIQLSQSKDPAELMERGHVASHIRVIR